jgi:hypothetical protein
MACTNAMLSGGIVLQVLVQPQLQLVHDARYDGAATCATCGTASCHMPEVKGSSNRCSCCQYTCTRDASCRPTACADSAACAVLQDQLCICSGKVLPVLGQQHCCCACLVSRKS